MCKLIKQGREMIHINDFNKETFEFEEAARIIKSRGNGNLLDGMKNVQDLWANYVQSTWDNESDYEDDHDFFSNWQYEINAYNAVHAGMSKLFAK